MGTSLDSRLAGMHRAILVHHFQKEGDAGAHTLPNHCSDSDKLGHELSLSLREATTTTSSSIYSGHTYGGDELIVSSMF
jgi:hypothetical protein